MNKKIILASASPRRRELLTQIGLDFDVVVSETEEKITSTEPAKVVEELSAQKAEAVWEKLAVSGVCQAPDNSADRMHEGCGVCDPEQKSGETTMTDPLVMGADTVVACDGKILGKPADTEAAAAMLTMLQGRGHEVYTGDAQIREYVATGDPMDKAGSYGIQGFCARYIRGIEGDYNNVVGLPVGRVYQELHGLRLV